MYRNPWEISSGGPDSGLYKSTDGGDTWTALTDNPGFPGGLKGRIGVAVSPAKRGRVWAMVEADDGGLYRSDDGGDAWELVNDTDGRGRPWYHTHVFAHPQDPETVWVMDSFFYVSNDGGRNFEQIPMPHGDHQDLWIDPSNPRRMIEANDGGATVTFNGGGSWSSLYNQPTACFYHLAVDNQYPYRVYGTQQDNSAISVPSKSDDSAIPLSACYMTGTSESGHIVVRPDNPNVVYSGGIGSSAGGGGNLLRSDHALGDHIELITVWPEETWGWAPKDEKYRFHWTYPIVISPHDPDVLYCTGNLVFRSNNEGRSWEAISPDLTRNDPTKLEVSGGPVTVQGVSGAETYCTIFAFTESPHERGCLLGRLRRRADPRLPRWRANLAERDAARPAGVDDRCDHRGLPPRRGDRLRGGLPLQAGRLQPLPVQDRGLRQDLAQDNRRHRAGRFHAGDPGGPGEAGPAVRGHGVRAVRVVRRRRVLAEAATQPARRAAVRPGREGRRSLWRARMAGRSGYWTTYPRCARRTSG